MFSLIHRIFRAFRSIHVCKILLQFPFIIPKKSTFRFITDPNSQRVSKSHLFLLVIFLTLELNSQEQPPIAGSVDGRIRGSRDPSIAVCFYEGAIRRSPDPVIAVCRIIKIIKNLEVSLSCKKPTLDKQ